MTKRGKLNEAEMRKKRILIAKMGMDGHDVGMKVVSKVLKDEGFEVIYLGPYQNPSMVAKAAVQEAVDLIALGSHSGEYEYFVPELMNELKKVNLDPTIKVVLAGLIPADDIPRLKEIGLTHIFAIGTSLGEVQRFFREQVAR